LRTRAALPEAWSSRSASRSSPAAVCSHRQPSGAGVTYSCRRFDAPSCRRTSCGNVSSRPASAHGYSPVSGRAGSSCSFFGSATATGEGTGFSGVVRAGAGARATCVFATDGSSGTGRDQLPVAVTVGGSRVAGAPSGQRATVIVRGGGSGLAGGGGGFGFRRGARGGGSAGARRRRPPAGPGGGGPSRGFGLRGGGGGGAR